MVYFNSDGAQYNIEDAFNIVSKMDMGGSAASNATESTKASCKISVCEHKTYFFLWNVTNR
jgi:hypothetical protein